MFSIDVELFGVLGGIASAISWGAADFCGGLASRRSGVLAVLFVSEVIGGLLLLAPALLWHETLPPMRDLLWAAAAGAFGIIGITAFYRGLSRGAMSVVAPISAVVAAALPVLAGALMEGLPPAIKYVGFGLGLISIGLISRSTNGKGVGKRELGLSLLAGLAFGAFFICLDQAGRTTLLWPLVVARTTALGLLVTAATITGANIIPARKHLPLIAAAGLLDTGGNLFYLLAARAGRLEVAAVLASLYPAATVLLARLLLHEHISQLQRFGIFAALAAVLLIAA